jgi:nitrogen fixation NifU-like protein
VSDLRELYQEVILDHGKRPRNFRLPEGPGKSAVGYNPLCGDRLVLKLLVEDGVIRDAGFQGHGCAISTASASTMTEAVKGKSVDEAHALFRKFHALLTGGDDAPDPEELGKLAVFGGVVEFPMRVKCATLAWHTLESALGEGGEVTTE